MTDFREATCRQYEEQTCSRGGYCNFMVRRAGEIRQTRTVICVCRGQSYPCLVVTAWLLVVGADVRLTPLSLRRALLLQHLKPISKDLRKVLFGRYKKGRSRSRSRDRG